MQTPDVSHLKSGEVSLGTTIMAVVFEGGVIIGADSRSTTGSYIANRVADKLTPIHDRIYCCRSGSSADTEAIADIVRYYCQMYSMQHENQAPTVAEVATLCRSIIYSNKDALSAGMIVAGWDKVKGPSVYNVSLGGSLVEGPWAIGGSGSTYIYGFCDATYESGWDRQRSLEFVRDAVSLAISRDGSSGGVVRMAVITEAGVERVFVPGNELPTFRGGTMGSEGKRIPTEVAA